MLTTVAGSLAQAGHRVSTVVHQDLRGDPRLAALTDARQNVRGAERERGEICVRWIDESEPESILDNWAAAAETQQAAWIIAPELDGVLHRATQRLSECRLFNCQNPMLDIAADKWLAYQAFSHAGLAQPPTQLACDVDDQWCHRAGQWGETERSIPKWILKPRDGAGCAGNQVVDGSLLAAIERIPPTARQDWIAQAFLPGDAYSISVALCGQRQVWFPPATQNIAAAKGGGLHYRGGSLGGIVPELSQMQRVAQHALAACGAGATGWVGVDMMFATRSNLWYVIEVNPRLTTSVVGLSQSFSGNLIAQVLDVWMDRRTELSGEYQPLRFSAQ